MALLTTPPTTDHATIGRLVCADEEGARSGKWGNPYIPGTMTAWAWELGRRRRLFIEAQERRTA